MFPAIALRPHQIPTNSAEEPNLIYHGSAQVDIRLSEQSADGLLNHLAIRQFQESVGVLIGVPGFAASAIRLLNSTAGPGSFRIEAFELARASRYAARKNQQIVALYHSHPSGDLGLSDMDRRFLAQSRWPWLVIALAENGLQLCGYKPGTGKPLRIIME